jgi:hypothetical protein
MMIIDAGVHVWRPQAPDRPWMPGRKAHLPEPLTYEKFSAMMKDARRLQPRSGAKISRSVRGALIGWPWPQSVE